MNRNHLWKLVLILVVLAWSLQQVFFPQLRFVPPKGRDLIQEFRDRGAGQDAVFTGIVERAQAAEREHPQQTYAHLQEAIGTNDITRYFPSFDAKEELEPTAFVLNRLQRDAASPIRLGLDLQGGTAFVMKMDTNRLENTSPAAALEQAVEVLRRRVDSLGVAEPLIQPEGSDRIVVQLPGLSEAAMRDAATNIQKAAFLEFKMVHPQSSELLAQGVVMPGYEILKQIKRLPGGGKEVTPYLVKRKAEMVGGIQSAGVTRGNLGEPIINFKLNAKGAETFARVTTENEGQYLAIILDGVMQTAPRIKEPITTGSGQISGDYTEKEAFQLASVLENPLQAPLTMESSQKVDPTLGSDSIRSGIKAALYGVLAVSVFMLVYYHLAGLVANVALMCNIVILLGIMCAIRTTFTLPGIAGVVLTVGMAVDANVLIFERIREEMAKGKSLRGALKAGYDRAFGTIFDSHVTTLISSIILWGMGTGSVKGFGVSLTWGVAASLFTALVITRLIFDWMLFKNMIKDLSMLHVIRSTKINFMRWAIPAFVASWTLIIVGCSYGIFVRGHNVFGVEFAGGEMITLAFDQNHKVDVDKLRKVAGDASSGEVMVGYQRNIGEATDVLRITMREPGDAKTGAAANSSTQVIDELRKAFPDSNFRDIGTDRVGPTVGAEIRDRAILAALMAMGGILVYVAFRYEFSFAIGAVVAIIHDVAMTFGIYFLSGRELNATTVAAILTIIGFSINDTIVIFDRIREDLKLGVRGTFKEVINQALNQTLSRTIITSGTVFLATFSLFIFGGGPINDFAFTFLVGIITGTYSSIYIASTLVLILHKGHRPKIGNTQLSVEGAAPARA